MHGNIMGMTLGSRFDAMAAQTPEHTAVIHEGTALTYQALQRQADALSSALLQAGVTKDSRIGMLCDRSAEWVAAMIAIVKLGAAYVPLAMEDPLPHIEQLAADVEVKLVLTDRDDVELSAPTLNLKRAIRMDAIRSAADSQPVTDDSLAYIMFTSGTTGKPKGVGVTQGNILNLTVNADYVRLDADIRVLQTGAPTFDASTFEVWGALLNGGTLVIPGKRGLTDFDYIEDMVRTYGITTMWLTAPLFHIAAEQNPSMFEGIRELVVGGDVVNQAAVNKVLEACSTIRVVNGYGPTECTTFSTTYRIPHSETLGPIPIGKPIRNASVHILNEQGLPVPQGEIGELYIGGKGVGAGYINRPELNAERFVDNPFGEGKLYRTGDRVSQDAAGNLHYYGRKDRQVKIRGYRIELAAVEAMLESIDEIESAAVCVVTNSLGGKEIGACVTVRGQREIHGEAIRQAFGLVAPSHVILTHLRVADAMPLNKNGKIDYGRILSFFEREQPASEKENGVPEVPEASEASSETDEARMMELISSRTGFPVTDLTTSFFELGIDSLMAVYLARDMTNAFGTKVSAVDILAHATLLDLMVFLGKGSAAAQPAASGIDGGARRSEAKQLPLLEQQKPFFVDYQVNPHSIRYNVPLLIELAAEVSVPRLMDALRQLVARHDGLRLQFSMAGTEMMQTLIDGPVYTIARVEGRPDLQQLIRPFDLTGGLPFRFALIESADSAWLFMDFHHIAVDGASLAVIVQDLNRLYGGLPLAEPDHNFAAIVEQAHEAFDSNRESSKAYWQTRLRQYGGMEELPTDKRPGSGNTHKSEVFRFRIGEGRTSALRAWAAAHQMTVFEGLMLGYACMLHAVTASPEVVFATPTRDYSIAADEPTVAMLTHTLWVHSEAKQEQPLAEFSHAFVQHLRESRKYEHVQLDEMYELLRMNTPEARGAVTDSLIAYHSVKEMQTELFGRPLQLKPISPDEGMFSLNLQIYDGADHLACEWEYVTGLFEPDTIASLCDMFAFMLERLEQQHPQDRSVQDLAAAYVRLQLA
ncbi:amino acid adenylation domain-containing protein [Paenibacillus phyllosphaerae]|uniref:Amino acid adenylation domain-containing protein n=1 Tax=Paenibacillus phyllosphaerae TaxID=274593 RepID=A0A7W5FPP7_9BACL|nr:non-ribosomal peptide synthetase [Paenibacillus phyllosphaerae]MBB3112259.1 amino acid adenylation domain-containing protein [Paenibacillus phyllosphaerae]